MKFNTLTFDANLPTTQQVNVPTNTDYKVGMKVKRNGEIQQLGPDEITIYTGEITPGATTVVGPADSPSNLERTVNGTGKTTIFMMFPKASLSAYTDKYIAPSDIEQTWHLSGETTSTPLEYGNLDIGYGVQYVEGSTVWYSYQGKWCRIASGAIAEKKDRVQIKDTALMRQNFNLGVDAAGVFFNGTIPTAEAPILVDSTITFHDEDTPVTIPTDADKTNGYVTFTQASNDDASFRQLKVAVNVPEVPATVEKEEDTFANTTGATVTGKGVELSVSTYPSLIGKTVTPENIYFNTAAGTGTTPPELSALEADIVSVWDDNNPAYKLALLPIVTNATTDTVLYVAPATGAQNRQTFVTEIGAPADKPFFAVYVNNHLTGWTTEYTLSEGDVITPPKSNVRNNNSRGWVVMVKLDDLAPAWNANFKLNVNEFKSQCGDLNVQTDPEFSTAKVEGTYADGTEFSYDFCIQ